MQPQRSSEGSSQLFSLLLSLTGSGCSSSGGSNSLLLPLQHLGQLRLQSLAASHWQGALVAHAGTAGQAAIKLLSALVASKLLVAML